MLYATRHTLALSILLIAACPAFGQTAPKPQKTEPAKAADASAQDDVINPDRPGIADGSTVIGPKKFQIEIGGQYEFHSEGGANAHLYFLPALLRLGINEKWEARIETASYTYVRTSDPAAGKSHTDGYSPISIGAKFHWQDGKGPKKPSLGAIGRVFVPSGSSDFKSNVTTGDFRFAADLDLNESGSWSLNPNLGVGFYQDGNGNSITALLAAMTLNFFNKDKTVNPFVDFGLQSPERRQGPTALILDTGIAYILNKDTQLDASVGTGVLGHTTPHPFWSVGISRRF